MNIVAMHLAHDAAEDLDKAITGLEMLAELGLESNDRTPAWAHLLAMHANTLRRRFDAYADAHPLPRRHGDTETAP